MLTTMPLARYSALNLATTILTSVLVATGAALAAAGPAHADQASFLQCLSMYAHSTDPATSIALGNEVVQDSGGSRSRGADAAVTIMREHNLSGSTASAIGLCALDAKFGLQSSSSTDSSQSSSATDSSQTSSSNGGPYTSWSNDDKFMNMLRSVGVPPAKGAGNWITVGHSMCDELSAGRASPSVAIDAANAGLPQIQANDMVDAAIQFYCPQFKNEYVQPHD
jgi:hypothetical protein